MVVQIKMFVLADQEGQVFCYLITVTKNNKYHKACSIVRKLHESEIRKRTSFPVSSYLLKFLSLTSP